MSPWVAAAYSGVGALGLSIGLVPIARRVALRCDATDRPALGKAHSAPTPYLGGMAVAAAVVIAQLVGGWHGEVVAIVGGAVLVACIGVLDDVRTTRPAVRLAVETVAASVAFAAGARVQLVGGVGDWVLTVVWLVVLTNAYNLLDNMDGCLSSVVFTSAGALVALAVLGDQVLVGALAAALTGAAAGFLIYNWHPALIFLGDAGSLFLGFLLSAVALKLRLPVDHRASVVAVAFIAGPALFDTTLVVLSRVAARRPIYIGGCDHTSHRLVQLGVPTRWIAPALATASAASAVLGGGVGRGAIDPLVVVPVAAAAAAFLMLLLRMPVYESSAGRLLPADRTLMAECVEVVDVP